ncbi:MAG: imidazolonepropionase [Deltaproteobacteria bacterium]|nr:imidazolonepropionase [Deltaproteobacteria bacterium]
MPVLKNIGQLATCRDKGNQADIYCIESAAIAWDGDTIVWVGEESKLPEQYKSEQEFNAEGKLVIPGLIDCHTHLAFGAWRADEFQMRVLGKSYLEIQQAGGGISSTVEHTRSASEQELVEKCLGHLSKIAKLGVTTIEAKSGYGLELEAELKLLRVYRTLGELQPVSIVPTFLGAHLVPAEYKDKRENYIDLLINEMLPAIAEEGLAEFCDIFVEKGAFSADEARLVIEAADEYELIPKLHVDQLSDGAGAALAAELGAISADHLEHASDEGILLMKEAEVVAVTLPLASMYTFETPLNARRFIDKDVPVAVATDFNPGSAPSFHLPLAMLLACTLNRMTPEESLKGATAYAAQAVDRGSLIGSIQAGKRADFVVIDAPSVNQWIYNFQANQALKVFKEGIVIAEQQ